MTHVRIEQYFEYGDDDVCETAIRLTKWRVFPMPMADKTVCLIIGGEELCLSRENCLDLAARLRKAATDG